jgi:transcriptional regulator with XRE-family HTH domain
MKWVVENLHFLLWKAGVPKEYWVSSLAQWIGGSEQRAQLLLQGEALRQQECLAIVDRNNLKAEDFLNARLLEQSEVNILTINLQYLLSELGWGGNTQIATKLKVYPATISKWCSGYQKPSRRYIVGLSHLLGIPMTINLEVDPVFLFTHPITNVQRRAWIHKQVDNIDGDDLNSYYTDLRSRIVLRELGVSADSPTSEKS